MYSYSYAFSIVSGRIFWRCLTVGNKSTSISGKQRYVCCKGAITSPFNQSNASPFQSINLSAIPSPFQSICQLCFSIPINQIASPFQSICQPIPINLSALASPLQSICQPIPINLSAVLLHSNQSICCVYDFLSEECGWATTLWNFPLTT